MSIEKAYNIWASQYDTNDNKTRDLDREATIQTLSKYNFKNVVELGCGTGKNTMFLLKKADKITGLDFSQEMLNKAKEKICDNRVKFQQTDLTNEWKINNDSADLITCSLILEHIKNLDFIFNQAQKKLKQNGFFYICELHPFKQYLGTKAKYESEHGVQELETYVHHISEFLASAENNKFKLIELKEWFDDIDEIEVPRLVSFVFRK